MKLIFCDNALEPFLNFRGHVAEHFHILSHEVSVIVPAETCTKKAMKSVPDFLKVYKVDMNRNGSNPLSDLHYFKQIKTVFRQVKPDLVFTYTIKPNIYGSIAAHSLGIPVVAMVAGLGYAFSGNSPKHILGRALYKYGLRHADRVIVLNKSNYETLMNGRFSKEEKLIHFEGGEGVSLTQFPFCDDDYTSVRFLMVARVLYDKGYSEYVDAARMVKIKYPDIDIELLGPLAEDSPMGVPAYVIKQDEKSGYIKYLGETNDVASFLSKKGVVAVLVSSYNEGFNRSLMEACAMGRICITSDIPGCKEIVKDGYNGYLVSPKDPDMLANAMLRLIEEPSDNRKKMAINSNTLAKKTYDIEHVLKKYDEIISSMAQTIN